MLVTKTTVLTVVVECVVTLAVVVVESVVGWYTNDGDQEDDVEVICLEVLLDWLLIEDGLDAVGSGDRLDGEFEYMYVVYRVRVKIIVVYCCVVPIWPDVTRFCSCNSVPLSKYIRKTYCRRRSSCCLYI